MELVQAQMDRITTIFDRQLKEMVHTIQERLEYHPGISRAIIELDRIKEYHEEDIPYKEIDDAIKALEEHKAIGWLEISYKDSPFDHAIQRYAQISSRHLSNQVYAHLPRELRDLIYSHIWTKKYLEKSVERMCLAGQGMNHPSVGSLPHVIEPTHANRMFAREAMEAYYHCAAGVVDVFVAEHMAWLPSVLYDDIFELGVKPAAYLRKLRLEIVLDHIDKNMAMVTLPGDLDKLFDIAHKKDFELHIVVKQCRIRLKLLDQALAIIIPFCRAFKAQGARVHLDWQALLYDFADTVVAERPFDYMINTWQPEDLEWRDFMVFYLDELDNTGDMNREYRYELEDGYDPTEFEDDITCGSDEDGMLATG